VVRSEPGVFAEREARKPDQAQGDDHQQKDELQRVLLPHHALSAIDARSGNGETVARTRKSGKDAEQADGHVGKIQRRAASSLGLM
jgi:hypothetical protein